MHVLQDQLDRIERGIAEQRNLEALRWHHQHSLTHEIASGVEDILDIVVKQPGGMTAEEVAAVTSRAKGIRDRLLALAADKPK